MVMELMLKDGCAWEREGAKERWGLCMSVLWQCVRVRVHWVQTGALTVCESHAPSTAVQCIKEEQQRNVTAFRNAPQAEPSRLSPHLIRNKWDCTTLIITSWNLLCQTFVYLSQQQRMTHQKSISFGSISIFPLKGFLQMLMGKYLTFSYFLLQPVV